MLLALLAWVAAGIVVGFIGTKFVNLQGDTPLVPVAVASIAAVVGGFVFAYMSGRGVQSWDLTCILVAAAVAAGATVVYHLVRSRSITKSSHTVRSSY